MRTVLTTLAVTAVLVAAGAIGFIYSGIYNVAATQQHTGVVYWAITEALTRSVQRHAEGIVAPDLTDPELVASGLRLYRGHCLQCHGAPGVAPHAFAMGMTPVPPYLVQTAREWSQAEIFWVVKHGIKMTGMPGWELKLTDPEIWSITAFVSALPRMSPVEYEAMARAAADPPITSAASPR